MVAVDDELWLGAERDAVPRARRYVQDCLRGEPRSLIDDAGIVATELVTNALLHAGPPVRVRMRRSGDGFVLEVEDTSRNVPLQPRDDVDSMTGRGIALVTALSRAWGVRPCGNDGKVVWAELAADRGGTPGNAAGKIDVAAILAARTDEPDAEPRFTIQLGGVPTDLLLEAKAHVDNLVREFSLAASGGSSDLSDVVPDHLASMVEAVVHGFSEARVAIKRQAIAAAERDDDITELTLTLPLSAADAGERYLAALDEADSYARAARILTLETPPAHRVFRHWYVEAIVDQLRRRAAGEPVPPPQTFGQRLIEELGVVAAAQRISDRAARLQAVTSALARVTTVEQLAKVVVEEGIAPLEASGGVLFVPQEHGVIVPAAVGFAAEVVERLRAEQPHEDLPAMVAARTGEPIWIESVEERDERFPELASIEPGTRALCAVPLITGERVLGALRFSFSQPRLFDDTERRFVLALAAQAAEAIQRSELVGAERAARAHAEHLAAHLAETARRLGLLQTMTTELTGAKDLERIAEIVVGNAAESFGAESARVYVFDERDESLRSLARRGSDPHAADPYESIPLSADLPGAEALRTGRPVVLDGLEEIARRYPDLADVYPDERRLLVSPLIVGDSRIGVISLSFRVEQANDPDSQMVFLSTLADACAQALQRAIATNRAVEARDKLAFLADASAVLSSSLDYRMTLSNVARLVVPRLADWCVVQVLEHDELHTLAVAHADPNKVKWAEELQRRYPTRKDAPSGVANVIRTGESELFPEISDEMLVAGAVDEEHLRILRELGMCSALAAPLTGRTGTFGAITLISAESGRRYDEEDRSFVDDLARRAAVAVETAHAFREQSGRLAAVTRVAAAAQRAILAPLPPRVGPVVLTARYVSAAAEALIGGDLYEVVEVPGAVRLLIGDVRGKGLDAVRTATVVLGEFRAAAVDRDDLAAVAVQMDRRVAPYLGDEDFITALVAEVTDDGRLTVASCGHPPALLAADGELVQVGAEGSLPLGLGATPMLTDMRIRPGHRLLLYTDGILEARDGTGAFVDFDTLVAPLADGELDTVLDRVLVGLQAAVGDELGDDLALLVAEFRPTD